MRVLIVRHGETKENVRHICQGQSHGTLTAKGCEEAMALGKELASEPVVCCYSSDLRRASDTAKLILSEHEGEAVPLVLDPRLRERYFGSFEGKVFPPYSDEVVPVEEVEKAPEIALRLLSFFEEITPLYGESETVMIVSHGYTLRVLFALLEGIPFDRLGEVPTPANCSVRAYTVRP